jgi:hypothetical protein
VGSARDTKGSTLCQCQAHRVMSVRGVAMPTLLVKGSFKVSEKAKPYGDTVSFIPDNVADWKLVPGYKPILPAADGHANIRLEGIDALETH